MTFFRFIILFFGLVFFLNTTQAGEKETVSTLSIAELVLQKGLDNIDLGLYPGSLLMHGMSELTLIHPDKELMKKRTLDLFRKYVTKEIVVRGNFISYEAGGSGAAMLYYLKEADVLRAQIEDGARRMMKDQNRSTEGIMIPPRMEEHRIFIDVAFAVTPYLLYAGMAFNRQDYIDVAVYHVLELFRILEDKETGLLRQERGKHGVNVFSEDNWSRGNGWGAFALAILVRDLPMDHPKRHEVDLLAKKFFTAVLKHQGKNGLWQQEMSVKSSYTETSGSGMMLFGLGIMIEKGLFGKRYEKNFIKGLRGYLAYIGCDGSVSHTCKGCLSPGKGKKEDYINHEWIFNDHHAFGPAVLAFTQAAKMGIKEIKPLKDEGCHAIMNPVPGKSRTYVRFIPERREDLAWENDRIAFRVYGPPVKDIVGSGIDVWAKSVSYPVINKWYRLNEQGMNYHVDRGEGCDFYNVGYYRGCGALAVWENKRPYGSRTFANHRILKNQKDEIEFELTYNSWDVAGYKVSEKKLVSMKKGTNLFKVTSTINSDSKKEMVLAVGLTFFKNPEIIKDRDSGLLSIWEQIDPEHGYLGTAVVVDPKNLVDFVSYEQDWFALIRVRPGEPFIYYAGAGWDGNKRFAKKEDWARYLEKEVGRLF